MSQEQTIHHILREWVEIFMRRSYQDFRRVMEETGLSHSQMGALMRLYHCQYCGVSDIAGHLGITSAAASQMIDRLVGQGLLERLEDPRDRRFKQLSLTTEGRALVEDLIHSRHRLMEELIASFTPEEQERLAASLTLLTEAARRLEAHSESETKRLDTKDTKVGIKDTKKIRDMEEH